MNPAVKYALIFVVLTAAFKVTAFELLPPEKAPVSTVMVYLLGDIMAVALAFKAVQIPGTPPIFIQNLKDALRPALLYAIFVGIFAFTYHQVINPEYMVVKREQMIVEGWKVWNELPPDDPYKAAGKEDARQRIEGSAETFNNPFYHATFSMLAFFFFGAFFSILLVLAYRRVPFVRRGLGG